MKMPELLNGHSLTVKGRIYPDRMSISLKADDLSTASMTVDANQHTIALGDWIRVYAPNGLSAVMYVKLKAMNYVDGTVQLNLEHVFGLLDEVIMFEEITPETMGGGDTVAAGTAIAYLLGKQRETIWAFGSCDFLDAQGWKFTNTTIKSALTDIKDAIQDCQWEFDQSVFPFLLSLKQYPVDATMEMRRNRAIDSLQISMDRSQMFTRVYPIGNKDLHLTEGYLERNTATWGVVEQTISDSSIDDEGLLRAWAAAQLKKNAEPVITVSISGADLSASTGIPLDKLTPGRICRVPLPEYNTTVTERLVEVFWRDCIADEMSVTCSLANEHKTVQGILSENARGGGASGAKSHVKTGCDLHDHEDRIDTEEEISSQAGMYLDDHGVIVYSTNTETMIGSRFVSLNNRADMAVGKYTVDVKKLIEYSTKADFPVPGVEGYFYGDATTNKVYAWKSDSAVTGGGYYVELKLDGDAKVIGYGSRESFPAQGQQGYYYADTSTGKVYVWDSATSTYVESKLGDHSAGYYVQGGTIATYINEAGEEVAHINADHVNISATSSIHALVDSIEYDANGQLVVHDTGGFVVEKTESGLTSQFGIFHDGNLDGGVCVSKINSNTTQTKIIGDRVVIGTDPNSTTTINGEFEISNGVLVSKRGAAIFMGNSGMVSINNGKLMAPTLQVNSNGTLKFGGNAQGAYHDLTYSVVDGMVYSLSLSSGVLKITTFDGTVYRISGCTITKS